MRKVAHISSHWVRVVSLLLLIVPLAGGQATSPPPAYPAQLPYSFSNFVWWDNGDLRALLKKRIPGLGDDVATTTAAEGRIRAALQELLREKGIAAEVQSQEPSPSALNAEHAPGAPPPAVVFRISAPAILVDKVVVNHAPNSVSDMLQSRLQGREGHAFSSGQDWMVRQDTEEVLQSSGYLEAEIDIGHGAPRTDGPNFVVDLLVSIAPGPQFRIAGITADGGPLLEGRDLSAYFAQKAGDVTGGHPFGRLGSELRAYYTRHGYADVVVNDAPSFDQANALVTWHLAVVPGPLYHLRSLVIQGLAQAQQVRVKELFGVKPGDVYDEAAISNLYHQISSEASLKGYSFSFSPKGDKATGLMDLSLTFYQTAAGSSVSVHEIKPSRRDHL